MKTTIGKVLNGGANAIVIHKGVVRTGHCDHGTDVGLIVLLSASVSLSLDPNPKVLVCTVEEAIKLGANDENEMLKDFGEISEHCPA